MQEKGLGKLYVWVKKPIKNMFWIIFLIYRSNDFDHVSVINNMSYSSSTFKKAVELLKKALDVLV